MFMTDEQILKMIEDLANEMDYDVAKSIFDDYCAEDPEEAASTRAALLRIAYTHISASMKE